MQKFLLKKVYHLAWHIFHSFSVLYPENPSEEEQSDFKNFLLSMKSNLKLFCSTCGGNSKDIFIESYNIDIDFVAQDLKNEIIQLFVKIEVNLSEQKQSGYSIFSEGVGIFEFDKDLQLSDNDKFNFIYISGLSICINSLRAIITNVTSYAPFGKYSLPSIDINELLIAKGIIKPKPTK